jgi:2,3-bisphosphoglycerate-independent phosphoglycerate mutase
VTLQPIVVVLLDGVADRAHGVLGGKTGVEAARTPNLDAL